MGVFRPIANIMVAVQIGICMVMVCYMAACASGTACDPDHLCPEGWQCLDQNGEPWSEGVGNCGTIWATPICDYYCTRRCELGSRTGTIMTNNDCPEPFEYCTNGSYDIDEIVVCQVSELVSDSSSTVTIHEKLIKVNKFSVGTRQIG